MEFLKDKKYFIGGFLVLILISGALYFTQRAERPIEIKFDERGVVVLPEKGSQESNKDYAERIVDLQKRIKEMMKKDDFGGETPEETLQLFIDALKAGETELASRYFVVNKREQMAKELAIGQERGHLEELVELLEKRERGGFYAGRDDKYEFVVIGDSGKWDGVAEFTFDLVKNLETKVWKIESL